MQVSDWEWWEWLLAAFFILWVGGTIFLAYIGRTPKGRPLTPREIEWERFKQDAEN